MNTLTPAGRASRELHAQDLDRDIAEKVALHNDLTSKARTAAAMAEDPICGGVRYRQQAAGLWAQALTLSLEIAALRIERDRALLKHTEAEHA